MFAPPYVAAASLDEHLNRLGHAVLDPATVGQLCASSLGDLAALSPFWNQLPPDTWLKDGGRYRFRRHSCFVVEAGELSQVPHRPHWQPLDYNALHGGIERLFEPMDPACVALHGFESLLLGLTRVASKLKGERAWFIESHQFRIDTAQGIGRPTPEGAHRDGVDLVAVFLVGRQGIKGGESRVFDAVGPSGQRFTMQEPWSLLLLDDARVIHETTPIQPVNTDVAGHRDTLVVTLRGGNFQGP